MLPWGHPQQRVTVFENVKTVTGHHRAGRPALCCQLFIDNERKFYCHRGLSELKQSPNFLIGTILSVQYVYEACVKHFDEE